MAARMAGNEERLQQQLHDAMEKLKEGEEREKNLEAELRKALEKHASELRRLSSANTGFLAEGSLKCELEAEKIGEERIFSPYTAIGGLPFRVGCRSGILAGEKTFFASLYCNDGAASMSFSALVVYSLSLDSSTKIAFGCRGISVTKEFKPSLRSHGFNMKWATLTDPSKGYIKNGHCTLEAKIKVICYDKEFPIDFASPDPNLSDMTLLVEGKQFNVCKTYLALHSEYFKALFFSDFAEKSKTEIELEDVNAVDFEEMLGVIYPQRKKVTAATVNGLLKMADFFDVPVVRVECTKFLKDSTDLSVVAKLKITEEYRLNRLQYELLEGLKKTEDLKPIITSDDFATLSQPLQNLLLQKHFKFT